MSKQAGWKSDIGASERGRLQTSRAQARFSRPLRSTMAIVAGFTLVLQLLVIAPADAGTALSQVFSFAGRYGSVTTGGTLRSQSNSGNACSLNSTSTANLTGIPASASITAAYLIWSGSGSSVDTTVTFQGSPRSADRTYTETFDPTGYNLRFFTGVDDVTSLVATTRNGNYTFGGLTVDTSSTYCSVQTVLSTWTMFVVYQDASQPNRVINLYEGLEYARGSATTATISGFVYPAIGGDAKFAAVVLEGDPDLSAALNGYAEQFTFNGTIMSDSYNPAANPYNSASNVLASSATYGFDLDSWNVSTLVAPGATSATLRVSSGADLVLVTAALLEVQSLVADLSLTKTVSNPTPSQSSTVTYTVILANAGTDAATGVAVTDQLPAGLTYLSHTVSQGTYSSLTGVWNVGTVNPAGSATMTITARVTATGGTSIVNTAQVSTSSIPDPDSKPGNNLPTEDDQASASITVNRPPVANPNSYTTAEDTPLNVAASGVLANDSDPDGDPITVTGYTQPANGAVTVNANGSLTYIPNPNFNGTNTFSYTIADGKGGTATTTVTVTVTPTNDPPVAVNDSRSTNEDTPVTVTVLANDSDPDGDPLTVQSITQPTHGAAVINAGGTVTYTPSPNFNGADSFTYTISDGNGGTATATANITVNPINDAPVALDDGYATAEDTPLTITAPGVLGNDSDPDPGPLAIASYTQPANGTVTLNPNGSFMYTPGPNYNGTDTFAYTVCDTGSPQLCDAALVTIGVTAVNDGPNAVDDNRSTAEDTPIIVPVLANDLDPDGDPLTVTAYTQPANGTAAINPDGTVTYTPDPDFNGPDTFTYDISDGNGGTDTATVTITVTPVNDPPQAADDGDSTPEDTPVTITVLANDSDPDGDSLTVQSHTNPADGTLIVNGDNTVTYTPDPNFVGIDSFTYTISDGNGGTDTATITITVNPVQDPPVAVDNAYTTAEDTPLVVAAPGVLGNDTDPDGDSLTVTGNTDPANGTVTVNPNGSLTYTPDPNYNGLDSFTYDISDGNGGTDTATITITVNPVQDPPGAVDNAYTTAEDTPLVVAAPGVLGNDTDPDGDTLTVTGNTDPANGTVTVNPNGSLTYTPNPNYNGLDSFTYDISDGNGGTDTATITITVTSVNDAPTAVDDAGATPEDMPVTISVVSNDTDPDGDSLTVTATTSPGNGTVAVNGDNTITYTPNPDYSGTDTFMYTVSDGNGGTATATATITVTAVNDPPVANDDFDSTDEDLPVTIDVLHDDSDIDGTLVIASVNVTTDPTTGNTTVNGDGTITYTPNPNFSGVDTFEYEVCDNDGACDTATVTVTVNPINDPPEAQPDSTSTPEENPVIVNVLANDSDPDGDALAVVLVTDPAHGTATINPDGTVTYTPDPNYNGPDGFTYQVCDPSGACDTATVTVTVNPINDPPVANDDLDSTDEDLPVTIDVLHDDSDIDGTLVIASVNVTTDPANGTTSVNGDGTITYTPNPNFSGVDTFEYEVCDNDGACDTATVTLTVNPINDPPEAQPDIYSTDEDTTLVVPASGVLVNDTDPDGDTLSVTLVTVPTHGTLGLNPNGSFTYTPAANYAGPDSFTYQVCDPIGACDTAVASLTLSPVNDAPVARDDAATTVQDTPVTVPAPGVLGNDSDVEGDALTVTGNTNPANGTVTVNGDGSYTYTPNAGYSGPDSFDYTISDGNGGTDTATVFITVNPLQPPTAVDDFYSTAEDTTLVIPAAGVLDNDTDPEGDPLTVAGSTQPAHGTVTVGPDGSFTYTPNLNYSGPDSFTYQVCDISSLCDTGSVAITVTPVNDPPVATNDLATTNEDTPAIIPVLDNDSDIDGTLVIAGVTVTTTPANGTTTVNADGTITYTPNPGTNGVDTFEYQVCDNDGACDTATVTVTVNPINDPPVATNDAATTNEDTPAIIPVLDNDSDPDGDTLTVVLANAPAHGTVVINGDKTITYTPNLNYSGPDSFEYQICDPSGACDTATVTVTVTPVNDPPVATNDLATTNEDTPAIIPVLDNDSDIDGTLVIAGVTVTTTPANGTTTVNADGTITYTPNPGTNGVDTFEYQVCDNDGACDTATVTVTVNPINDPPVATNDAATTNEDTPAIIPVLDNDSDPDGDTLTVVLANAPAHGTVVINGDKTITYTPNLNYSGPDSFEYQICDPSGACDTATVTVTVTPVNDNPTALDNTYSTPEDTPLVVGAPGALGNDSDPDGDTLTVPSHTNPTHGSVTVNPDGSLTYTPNLNYSGPDSFEYQICDPSGACDTATVTVTVTPVNDNPTALDNTYSTPEDTPLVVGAPGALGNDSDPDGDTLTVQSHTNPTHGSVTVNPDGSLTYTPNPNYVGTDTFTYTISDGNGGTDTATITITIGGVNDDPVALDDSGTTPEDTPAIIPVLDNDSDPDGDTLTVVLANAPAHGTVVINGDNTITYTPNLNYSGPDSFEYQICDPSGACDTATVTVTVTPVNDNPTALDNTYSTPEDTPLVVGAPGALGNDSDPDGDTLTVPSHTNPTHGSVTVNPDGSLTYTPNLNYSGPDSFEYQICDPSGACDTATVTVTVTPVNDNPTALDNTYSTPEDTPLVVGAPGALGNDSDPDGDTLTVQSHTNPTHGSVTVNPDGSLTYTPNPNYVGTDTFTYTISDGNGGTDTATITITIGGVNDDPVALDDSGTTPEDTPAIIPVLDNDSDPDGDTLTVVLANAPAHGTVVINGDNTITYTPNLNYSGPDSFEYQICDPSGACDTATVTVTVTPVNDNPTALDNTYSTPEDTPLVVGAPGALGNDSDPDGDTLTVQSHTNPTHGSVTVNPDGSLTYTPNPNYVGTDTFTYTISDGNGGTDTATITITIGGVNDDPVALDDSGTTPEDTPITINVLGNDSDPDGDTLTVQSHTNPTHGSVTVNPDGSLTYTPDPNYVGTDTFTYTISDGNGGTDTATITITVGGVNDDPVALDNTYSTPEDTPLVVGAPGVLGNDVDPDGDTLTVQSHTNPTHGSVTVNPDGSLTYTPNPNYVGTDTFTYTISDGNGGTDTATITITIGGVNDDPVALDDSGATPEDTPITIAVLGNDTDVDGDPLLVESVTDPTNGMATINGDNTITYTPDPNYVGTDTFTYTISDGNGGTDTASVTITITAVNDNPTALDDSGTTPEDTPVTITVLGNDTDPDGDTLSVTGTTTPADGTVTVNGDNTITYTPDPNYVGTDTFTYTITDGNGGTATATVTIAVVSANDPPVAGDDATTTLEDTPVIVPVLDNDTDVEGDTLAASLVTQPANGTAIMNPDGTVTYTPNPNYSGIDIFTYRVCDNGTPVACDEAAVTIVVTPVNDPPVAGDDGDATDEDTPVTLPVLSNDADVDGDTLTIGSATDPANGTVVINGDNTITYTPDLNFTGTDTFDYTITDGNGGTDTATVTITVSPVGDRPTALDDTATTDEDTAVLIPEADLLNNDTDPDGDLLTIISVTDSANGTVVLEVGGDVTYTPDPGFNGTDTFTYQVCDPGGACDNAAVTVTVNPVNDPPVAVDDTATTIEDTPVDVSVLLNDGDPDGDTIRVTQIVTNPANGTATINGDNTITYTPNPNFSGTDAFQYEITDDNGGLATAWVSFILVNPVNDPPVALDDTTTVPENNPAVITVLGNDSDIDGDPLWVTGTTAPANGTVVINGDNTITYTPNPNFNGTDTFTYTITDGNGRTATATVTVTVTAVNDDPVAADDAYSTGEDTPITIPAPGVLGNDTDIDGDPLTVTANTSPTNGTVTVNPDGSLTYTPNPGYVGPDTFTYTITDGNSGTATATVTVTVTAVNDDPVAADDAYSTGEDTPITIPAPGVLGNDTDIDGDPLTVTANTSPTNGTVTVNPDGSLTYTPNPGYIGTDTFTYTITDGNSGTATATVTVTVTAPGVGNSPVNNAPTAIDDLDTTDPNTAVVINVLANDSDIDGNGLTVASATDPANGTVFVNADGTITYTPDPGYTGTDTFTYTITDGEGGTATATVGITVTITGAPANNPPAFTDNPANTHQTVAVGGTIAALTGGDPDNDPYGYVLAAGAFPPGVSLNPDGTFNGSPTEPGTYAATVTICDVHGACSTGVLTILVQAQLPFTGFDAGVSAAYGLLLILLGSLLVARTRRSRKRVS